MKTFFGETIFMMVYEMHFVASYGRKLLHESSDETNPAAGGAASSFLFDVGYMLYLRISVVNTDTDPAEICSQQCGGVVVLVAWILIVIDPCFTNMGFTIFGHSSSA